MIGRNLYDSVANVGLPFGLPTQPERRAQSPTVVRSVAPTKMTGVARAV